VIEQKNKAVEHLTRDAFN